jgi:hypothetical protein
MKKLLVLGLIDILYIAGMICLLMALRLVLYTVVYLFFPLDSIASTSIFMLIILGVGILLTIAGLFLLHLARQARLNLNVKEIQDSLKLRARRAQVPPIKWE